MDLIINLNLVVSFSDYDFVYNNTEKNWRLRLQRNSAGILIFNRGTNGNRNNIFNIMEEDNCSRGKDEWMEKMNCDFSQLAPYKTDKNKLQTLSVFTPLALYLILIPTVSTAKKSLKEKKKKNENKGKREKTSRRRVREKEGEKRERKKTTRKERKEKNEGKN